MKKLSILFLFIPFVAMGQIWPTDVQYQFLNGIYAGNYGNLHITSDGDIDTIKGSAYDWPDSIRVADAGKRYYLTGVYSGGQYDMDWRRPSKADVSDLVENQFVFGGSDGSISQSEYVLFDNGMYAGYGAGIRIRNESSPMVLPSWAMLRLEALEGNAEIQLQAGSIAKSGIRFFNWTGNTQWYVHMDESENFLIQNLSVHPDDFRVNAATLRFTENELGEHTFFMNGGGFEIQNNDNPAVLKLDQDGTEFTIANDGTSLEIDADAVDITGDLTAANLAAGTYTPTAANVSNCATFGTVYGHYMSYGNMVWINIKVDINATSSSTLTTASFTLPAGLTSDFTASQDVIGNMSWITTINGSGGAGRVYADATSDLIYVEYRPSNTITFQVNITASYVIQ